MEKGIYYWQVPMPEWDIPIRITERTNQAVDIQTSDWSLHWHESLEFQFILSGSITFACNGRQETLGPGDTFFANWCIPHHATAFSDGTHYYVLQVDPGWLLGEDDKRLSRFRDLLTVHSTAFSPFVHGDDRLMNLAREIVELYHNRPFGWEVRVKGLFLSLVGVYFADYYDREPAVQNVTDYSRSLHYARDLLNYIAHHYNENINLDALSREFGLTRSYLCRVFQQHTGSTIITYLNRLRCYQAIYLMETGSSVTEAALAVGFNDYNYFSRIFKKTIGCRPSDSLQAIREDLK